MTDGFKAHEGPGGQGEYGERTAQRGVVRGKSRFQRRPAAAVGHGRDEAQDHADQQPDGRNDLHPHGDAPAQAEQRRDPQRRHGQQNLAQIDAEARDLIVKAKLERIAQQRPRDQRKRRGIGPDDGDIGQYQEPRAQKAVVVAKAPLGIGIGAAAVGEAVHQVMIVQAEDQHHQRPDGDAQGRACGSGDGQKGGAGHNKGSPAHAAPEGQRPRAES